MIRLICREDVTPPIDGGKTTSRFKTIVIESAELEAWLQSGDYYAMRVVAGAEVIEDRIEPK